MNNDLFCFRLEQGLQGQRVSDYTLPMVWSVCGKEIRYFIMICFELLNTNNGNAALQSFRAPLAPVGHQDLQ